MGKKPPTDKDGGVEREPPENKGKAWDYLEKRGLNEKPGETPMEKRDRSNKKGASSQTLSEIAPDEYPDAADRLSSATASNVISTRITEDDSQKGRSKKGNDSKTEAANRNAQLAMEIALRIAKKETKYCLWGFLPLLRKKVAEEMKSKHGIYRYVVDKNTGDNKIKIPLSDETIRRYIPHLKQEIDKL